MGIKLLSSAFFINFWFLVPVSRGAANARFAPPADAHGTYHLPLVMQKQRVR